MLRLNTRIGGSESTPTTAFAGPRRCRFRTKGVTTPALAPVHAQTRMQARPRGRRPSRISPKAGTRCLLPPHEQQPTSSVTAWLLWTRTRCPPAPDQRRSRSPHRWKGSSAVIAIEFHATRARWRSSPVAAARSSSRARKRASPSSGVRRSPGRRAVVRASVELAPALARRSERVRVDEVRVLASFWRVEARFLAC